MSASRILLAAPKSGSGKTLLTCGLLTALKKRKVNIAAFKCGPDFIDPMFHSKVIGIPSRNLDTFFAEPAVVRGLLKRHTADVDMAVIEGVMGYFDGLGGVDLKGSTYDVADVTDTPVILLVNARGMSRSAVALVKGFKDYVKNSHIKGIILNQTSKMMYPTLKKMMEEELGIKAYGYIPAVPELVIESRHLGLVMPGEIEDLSLRLDKLADILEESLDIDGIIELAATASEIDDELETYTNNKESACNRQSYRQDAHKIRIGIALDQAFCFYYEDNTDLLKEMGLEPVYFSPIEDSKIPEGISGLIIGGGYPELYAERLSRNESMKKSIKEAYENGMPLIAECGGFMYLHRTMEDVEGNSYNMVGIIDGHVTYTGKLGRFGYINLTPNSDHEWLDKHTSINGHEFHYFDSSHNGEAYHAAKPLGKRSWDCVVTDDNLYAGFPHLYYYSNPQFAAAFVDKCQKFYKKATCNTL